MDQTQFRPSETLSKTTYFKSSIERLLSRLHPTFVCPRLIVKVLLHGPSGSGKIMLARAAAKTLNLKLHEERVSDLLDDNIVGTDKKIRSALTRIDLSGPSLIYLSGFELICYLDRRDIDKIELGIEESLSELLEKSTQPIIFIAATNDFDKVSKSSLSYIFHHDVIINAASSPEAEEIVETLKREEVMKFDLSRVLESLSDEGKDYYLGNIIVGVKKAEVTHCAKTQDNGKKDDDDRGTRWMDIGGLGKIKEEIIDAIQLSIDYPQLKKSGLRRTGVLLYGPPGTGKTLLAKAVATECNLKFFNVKGPELLNEYVGQSEDNVRKLFKEARNSRPSVIFFDEIDSLAPNRGQAGDSGGVMDRMVSQLLAELDGAGKCDGVYVIGATNRVDLVDPSLMRPGRFDKVLEVPLPATSEDRVQILQALTRKMQLASDVDLAKLEMMARPNMSGADFKGLCSRALQKSFDRCIDLVEAFEKTEDEVEIITCMVDFLDSLEMPQTVQ